MHHRICRRTRTSDGILNASLLLNRQQGEHGIHCSTWRRRRRARCSWSRCRGSRARSREQARHVSQSDRIEWRRLRAGFRSRTRRCYLQSRRGLRRRSRTRYGRIISVCRTSVVVTRYAGRLHEIMPGTRRFFTKLLQILPCISHSTRDTRNSISRTINQMVIMHICTPKFK